MVTTRLPVASALPVRRRNGTPRQRSVVDPGAQRDEGGRLGVAGDAVFIAVAVVLAVDDVVDWVEGAQVIEDDGFGVVEGVGREARGPFHRDEAEYLREVRDDHVAKGTGLLVEAGAPFEPERLGTSI